MSCGTRVQDVGPGDPDGARLLRSSLWDQLLTRGVLLLRSCSRRPLITAGHPVRSPAASPSCNRSGFATPPPHRPANCTCMYCSARQFVSAGPYCLSRLRQNHNHATGAMSTPTNADFRVFDREAFGLEQAASAGGRVVSTWLTGHRRGNGTRQAEPDIEDPETWETWETW